MGDRPLLDIRTSVINQQACAQGYHAWVPWLDLGNGLWLTWCARQGCEHKEQYDHG